MTFNKKLTYLGFGLLFSLTGIICDILLDITNVYVYLSIVTISTLVSLAAFYKVHKGTYILDKAIYLSLFVICAYIFPFAFPNLDNYIKAIYFLGMGGVIYGLLLSFNIYIVAEKVNENIPLIQPARLIVFITTIMGSFLFATVNYKLIIFSNLPLVNLLIKSILFFVYYYLIFYTIRWFFLDEKIGELKAKNLVKIESISFFAVLVITQLSIVLMYFPYEAYASSIILSVTTYILMNLIQNLLVHNVNTKYILESVFLIVLSLFIAFFIS
ncbi:MAG: hypothetical protein QG570_217 [Patescibacteria group bacterium]|nr:hypothetical protein [Patescibacteria group bacterium]